VPLVSGRGTIASIVRQPFTLLTAKPLA
jgi:hypothetical protein